MTRTRALLLSFFGPLLVLLPLGMVAAVMVGEAREATTAESTRTALYAAAIAVGIVGLVGGFSIRVRYAGWYVRDKRQKEGWKWISLLGVWGLIVMLVLPDLAGGAPPPAARSRPGLSNWVAYLLIALGLLLVGLMIWSGLTS